MVDAVLASDDLGPEQFKDIWSRTVERSGEHMLVLAMVEQAVEDLGRYRSARSPEHRRIFDQTHRWITSNDRTWPYSFASICEALDLPRAAIRARLLIEDGPAKGRAGGSVDRRESPAVRTRMPSHKLGESALQLVRSRASYR